MPVFRVGRNCHHMITPERAQKIIRSAVTSTITPQMLLTLASGVTARDVKPHEERTKAEVHSRLAPMPHLDVPKSQRQRPGGADGEIRFTLEDGIHLPQSHSGTIIDGPGEARIFALQVNDVNSKES